MSGKFIFSFVTSEPPPSSQFFSNLLISDPMPVEIDERHFRFLFSSFVTDKKSKYPIVKMNYDRTLSVEFDIESKDAFYAYIMLRKTSFMDNRIKFQYMKRSQKSTFVN